MKLQPPRGCRVVVVDGTEIAIDATGFVEVPDAIAADLIAYHGFKLARGEGIRPAGRGDKKAAK